MKFEGSYYNDSNSNNNNNNNNNNRNISNNNTITTSKNEASSQENAIDVVATAADTGIATEINKNTYSNDKSSKLFKYSKSSSFCLKAFLEKTKSKVLNSNSTSTSNSISCLNNCTNDCCQQQHRLLTRTNRSSLKMLNHHNLHHHHKINIIKPIALRPNQAEMLKPNATLSYLNDLNSNYRFASIDSINSSSSSTNSFSNSQRFALKSSQASMQRRNTMPRVNFKNISFTAYVTNASNNSMNQCQPQRPQLNFIKMKLQRYLNENCNDCVLDASSDLFKMKKFDILSLATLNLNGKSTTTTTSTYQETPITCIMNLEDNIINNYKYISSNTNNNVNMNVNSNYNNNNNNNNDNIRNSLSASSSVSSLSSSLSNQNTFQMCLSSSNESDLDIAQIENDLNF